MATIERTINFGLPIPPAGKTPWQQYYSEAIKVLDSIVARFIAIGGFLGAWQNSTQYSVGNKLVDTGNGVTYQCVVAHVSDALPTTFTQDRAARVNLWTQWASTGVGAGVWATSHSYGVGDFVSSGAQWAVCILSHTSGATFAADLALSYWSVLVDLTAYGTVTFPVTVAQGGTNATDAATARTNLGLVIGTNVQAYNGNLATVAAMGDVANLSTLQGYASMATLTTLSTATITAAGLALLDDAAASNQRTTLGLAIGTDVAAIVTLTAGLGLSGGGDLSTNRTFAFDPTELTLVTVATNDKLVLQDVSDSGNPKTGLASDLIGREKQQVRTELTSTLTGQGGTGGTPAAVTGLAATITPSTGNDVRIRGVINLSTAAAGCNVGIIIKRDTTVIGAGAAASSRTPVHASGLCAANQTACFPFDVLDVAPGTSAFVYSVYVVVDQNQTWSVNRSNSDTDASTFFRSISVIEAIEIKR